jgi:RimJ/RimL family protein N-acetyltransferase
MTQLRTARFLLRPFNEADAPAFAAAVRESASSVGLWMDWAHAAYSEDEALAWFALCDAARAAGSGHEFGIFLEDGETLAGGAGLNHFNTLHGFCNLGYWVRASCQRQGAALAAVDALARHAFDVLKQSRVEIVVADGNLPSFGVARKAGATWECLARNRLRMQGKPVAAHVFSLVPEDALAG